MSRQREEEWCDDVEKVRSVQKHSRVTPKGRRILLSGCRVVGECWVRMVDGWKDEEMRSG